MLWLICSIQVHLAFKQYQHGVFNPETRFSPTIHLTVWKAHNNNTMDLSTNRLDHIVLLGNAYSPKTSNHKGAIVTQTSNAFTAAPLLFDYDISDEKSLENRYEAEEYLLGHHTQ